MATVSITFSPITDGDANTQKTSTTMYVPKISACEYSFRKSEEKSGGLYALTKETYLICCHQIVGLNAKKVVAPLEEVSAK